MKTARTKRIEKLTARRSKELDRHYNKAIVEGWNAETDGVLLDILENKYNTLVRAVCYKCHIAN